MQIALTALVIFFLASLAANILALKQIKKLKKHPPAPPPQQTYDAAAILHDLTAGPSLVKIVRVAPNEVFLRSPRDQS